MITCCVSRIIVLHRYVMFKTVLCCVVLCSSDNKCLELSWVVLPCTGFSRVAICHCMFLIHIYHHVLKNSCVSITHESNHLHPISANPLTLSSKPFLIRTSPCRCSPSVPHQLSSGESWRTQIPRRRYTTRNTVRMIWLTCAGKNCNSFHLTSTPFLSS